jgi:hypothetical protein
VGSLPGLSNSQVVWARRSSRRPRRVAIMWWPVRLGLTRRPLLLLSIPSRRGCRPRPPQLDPRALLLLGPPLKKVVLGTPLSLLSLDLAQRALVLLRRPRLSDLKRLDVRKRETRRGWRRLRGRLHRREGPGFAAGRAAGDGQHTQHVMTGAGITQCAVYRHARTSPAARAR